MTHEIQIAPSTYLNTQITRRINVSGIDVDEGLHPNSVLKHNNILNAMINMAFKHLNIHRLSPFRGLQIRGEGENTRPIPNITKELKSGLYLYWVYRLKPPKSCTVAQCAKTHPGCYLNTPRNLVDAHAQPS